MQRQTLTRRDFLLRSATAGTSAVLAACSAPSPEVIERIVRETVVVEQVVKETVVVEQVVEKIVEVDSRRAEMTLGYTPMDQEGTFNHLVFGWDAETNPGDRADIGAWFGEMYPNLKYEQAGIDQWEEYWEVLPAMMAAGNPPDVAKMWFGRTAWFACRGWMHPIDDYIDVLPPPDWPDDYHQVAEDNMAYQGVQYGLAWDWAPRCVLINRDIMEEAGMPYPVSDNWTWEEVLEFGIAATKETEAGRQFGVMIGHQPVRLWNMVRAWGGRFFDEDATESRFDDPATVECIQWLWDATFEHRVMPDEGESAQFGGDFWPLFEEEGRIGMVSTLSDETKYELEVVGDTFRLGIGPEPVGPSGRRFGFEGNCGWIIPNRSNWPDIAYEFMRWRLTDDEQILRMAVSGFGGFPARKSAGRWNVVTIEEKLPEYGHAAWEIGAENQEHFPLFPEFQEWSNLYWKWLDPVLAGGNPDVEGALLGLHEETNDLFSRREPCAGPGTG